MEKEALDFDGLADRPTRNVVSSGEPSLNGSSDHEEQALSDSEVQKRETIQTIAKNAKGPSSEHLEHECEKNRLSALKAEHAAQNPHSPDEKADEEVNEKDEWQDLLGSGDLLKKTLVEGTGPRAQHGQIVRLEVEEEGTKPITKEFVLGHGFVIDAWDLGCAVMSVGEKCLLKSRSRFISPTAEDDFREFILTLHDAKDADSWKVEEHVDQAREHGNNRYNAGEYERAIRLYDYGLSLFDEEQHETIGELPKKTTDTWKYTLLSNKAACLIKLEEWAKVIELTEEISTIPLKSLHVDTLILSKLLLRRADAYMKQRKYEEAQVAIQKCLSNDADNKHAQLLLEKAKTLQKRDDAKLNKTYRNMLKALGKEENPRGRLRRLIAKPQVKWLLVVSMLVLFAAIGVHFFSPNRQ
ncbi:Peptidylprolyl isomerase [Aphelenchoides fujianensis]|nr:Peptidylprolyl isomerase [Aphelenchoides fujianensis]